MYLVLPFAFGTVWAAAGALLLAVPVAIGIALFISHYAPRRIAQGLGYIIDLLAAVPSVVFGLWGIKVLAPMVTPFYTWLVDNFGTKIGRRVSPEYCCSSAMCLCSSVSPYSSKSGAVRAS